MDEKYKLIESEVRQSYGNVVWTYVIHHKDADLLTMKNNKIKKIQIILSGITSSGIISIIFVDKLWLKIITALIALGQTFFSTYLKNFELGRKIERHKKTADELWLLREIYIGLITEIKLGETPHQQLCQKKEKLKDKLSKIYKVAPKTSSEAYELAKVQLEGGVYSFSDEELDSYLPKELKK